MADISSNNNNYKIVSIIKRLRPLFYYVQDVRYAAGAWMHRSGAYMDVVYVPKGQEPEGTRISLGMREILLSMDAQERRTWT
jgi:hypothetical protein